MCRCLAASPKQSNWPVPGSPAACNVPARARRARRIPAARRTAKERTARIEGYASCKPPTGPPSGSPRFYSPESRREYPVAPVGNATGWNAMVRPNAIRDHTETAFPSRVPAPRSSTTTGTRLCERTRSARANWRSHATEYPLALGKFKQRGAVCHARQLPPPRYSPQRRLVQRRPRHLPLSRLGVRALQRPLRTDPSLSSHDHLDATRIYATAFPCEERDGHAWVYIPGPGSGRKAKQRSCALHQN